MAKKSSDLTFEQSLSSLEKIVLELEKGDIPLDDALKQFEQGIALVRQSQQKLEQAQQKISILLDDNGQETLAPFDNEGDK
ncbi:exodeoxyribonuclease VII small subunit [Parashewanella tropica]|uniref:exodeoxyribonuclease VII small subunit n=1 Tax=Parashewanella tropica TaxID=2547970 RepID=UPI00105A189F|nr:exodeoxyribonuclease VII small subunit [Parashewanella tropica]